MFKSRNFFIALFLNWLPVLVAAWLNPLPEVQRSAAQEKEVDEEEEEEGEEEEERSPGTEDLEEICKTMSICSLLREGGKGGGEGSPRM